MNHMLSVLAGRSLRAGRMRNLIAVLAIMLTAILFTTVTTVGTGAAESMILTMQMLKGSRSDGRWGACYSLIKKGQAKRAGE